MLLDSPRMPPLKTVLFHAAAALSLVLAITLAIGYVGRQGPILIKDAPLATPPRTTVYALITADGLVTATWSSGPAISSPLNNGRRLHWYFHLERSQAMPRRWFWAFDNRFRTVGAYRSHTLFCPIWCLALPCLLLPTLWLQRYRRDRDLPGFSVLSVRPPSPPRARET